jgi:hypothetical protein
VLVGFSEMYIASDFVSAGGILCLFIPCKIPLLNRIRVCMISFVTKPTKKLIDARKKIPVWIDRIS